MQRARTIVVLFLLACGQAHEITRAEYCDRLVAAYCLGIECCSDAARRYADADACATAMRPLCASIYEGGAFDAGVLVFDPEGAAQFVDAQRDAALACDRVNSDAPAPFSSTGIVGTSCAPHGDDTSWQYACGPGLACAYPAQSCVMTTPPTGTCETHGDCYADQYCETGTCMDVHAIGEACPAEAGADADRWCESDHCEAGACAPRRTEVIDRLYCRR